MISQTEVNRRRRNRTRANYARASERRSAARQLLRAAQLELEDATAAMEHADAEMLAAHSTK